MSFLRKSWAFTIALVILLGIGAFTLYSTSKKTDPIRVYELPGSSSRSAVASQVAQVRTPPGASTQENWLRNDNVATTLNPPTDVPAEENLAETVQVAQHNSDTRSGDDPTFSHSNPVPREAIEDARRDLEWFDASDKYYEKFSVLDAEFDKLQEEFHSLMSRDLDQTLRDLADPSYLPRLKAWQAKMEAWEKKDEELYREKPVRPIPTHIH